jgi:hypothetical protein
VDENKKRSADKRRYSDIEKVVEFKRVSISSTNNSPFLAHWRVSGKIKIYLK